MILHGKVQSAAANPSTPTLVQCVRRLAGFSLHGTYCPHTASCQKNGKRYNIASADRGLVKKKWQRRKRVNYVAICVAVIRCGELLQATAFAGRRGGGP